jgi:hypothetical protein
MICKYCNTEHPRSMPDADKLYCIAQMGNQITTLEAVVREKCEDCSYLKSFPVAQEEITRLEAAVREKDEQLLNNALCHDEQIAALTAPNAKYREALEKIARAYSYERISARIAQAALRQTEGGGSEET